MDMKIAPLWNRVGGGLIDLIIVIIISGAILFVWGFLVGFNGSELYLTAQESDILWKARGLLVGLIVDGTYTVIMMAGEKQATYGQQAVGIKTIKDNGLDIGYDTAIGRWIVSLISSLFLKLGFIIAIFTNKNKTLHDLLAGTVVIMADTNVDANEMQQPVRYAENTFNNVREGSLEKAMENDESIYEQIYEEFHSSRRKKGMYVKLLTNFDGDIEKAELEYIKTRVNEIKQEKKERIKAEQELENDAYQQIGLGKYKKGTVAGVECLFFESGEGAIITKEGKYRIYRNQKDLAKSALYYKDMSQYLTTGYIKTIDLNEKNITPKTATIKCTRCEQKIRIKNITGMLECPSCGKKWLHEQITK